MAQGAGKRFVQFDSVHRGAAACQIFRKFAVAGADFDPTVLAGLKFGDSQ
jgi:hypothetical protein